VPAGPVRGPVSPAADQRPPLCVPCRAGPGSGWVSRVPTVKVLHPRPPQWVSRVARRSKRVRAVCHSSNRTRSTRKGRQRRGFVPAAAPGDVGRARPSAAGLGAQGSGGASTGAAVPPLVPGRTPGRGGVAGCSVANQSRRGRCFSEADSRARSAVAGAPSVVSLAIARTTGVVRLSPLTLAGRPRGGGHAGEARQARLGRPPGPGAAPSRLFEVGLVHLVVAGQVVGRGARAWPAPATVRRPGASSSPTQRHRRRG